MDSRGRFFYRASADVRRAVTQGWEALRAGDKVTVLEHLRTARTRYAAMGKLAVGPYDQQTLRARCADIGHLEMAVEEKG